MRGTPLLRHTAATASMGRAYPKTLETWVQTTARTFSSTAFSKPSAIWAGSKSRAFTTRTCTSPTAWMGRVTALCS